MNKAIISLIKFRINLFARGWIHRILVVYILPIITIALITLFKLVIFKDVYSSAFLFSSIVIILHTLIGGRISGLFAALVMAITFKYFFLPPYNSFEIVDLKQFLQLALFLLQAFVISAFIDSFVKKDLEIEKMHTFIASNTNKVRNIIDSVFSIIVIANTSGKLLEANKSFARLFKNRWDSIINKNILEIYPWVNNEKAQERMRNALKFIENEMQITYEDKLQIQRKSKEKRNVEISMTLLDKESEYSNKYVVITVIDITHRKEIERKKDEFIGIMSHELKTPMTTLNGYIQLLSTKILKKNPEFSEFISLLEDQLYKLNSLISQLHDISRIDLNKLNLNKKEVDICTLIKSTIKKMRPFLIKHYIEFDVPEKEVMILIDPSRIEQVIINFIMNSIIHSDAEGKIVIRLIVDEKEVRLEVQDYGKGIKQKKIPHLFTKFYQAVEQNEIKEGLGLGLFISSMIIKAHDGQIGVESKYKKGSTFFFTLPLNQP